MELESPKTKKRRIDSEAGKKQFIALLQAIKSRALYDGQVEKSKQLSKDEIVPFLQEKLVKARSKISNDLTLFDYLRKHSIDSKNETVEKNIKFLLEKHKPCKVTLNHHQLKLASSTKEVTPSDSKSNKVRGLIQIQSYNLSVALDQPGMNLSSLKDFLQRSTDADRPYQVGAHLCKRICIQEGHVISLRAVTNFKNHETCPSFWIVRDKLVCLCSCDEKTPCLAPGPEFNADLFKKRLQTLVNSL